MSRPRFRLLTTAALGTKDLDHLSFYQTNLIPACTVSVNVYNICMIVSFGDEATADLYHGRNTKRVRRFPHDITKRALRKLDVLNGAHELIDLRSPPGNRLEALTGDWRGYHSIRVNEQWRLVFRWEENNVHDVNLTDYH